MNHTSVKSSGALCNVPTKYVKIVESSEAAHIREHVKLNEAMGNHIIRSIQDLFIDDGDPNKHGPKRMVQIA